MLDIRVESMAREQLFQTWRAGSSRSDIRKETYAPGIDDTILFSVPRHSG